VVKVWLLPSLEHKVTEPPRGSGPWQTIRNPANLEFRIIRPLLTTHPYDSIPYPPKDLILSPYTITLGRAEARALGSARRPVGPARSLLGLGEC